MKETIELAREELKRADHLYFVSLKYTKTVDVIKNVIERLIGAYSFSIDSMLLFKQSKKKIDTLPTNPIERAHKLKELFADDPIVVADMDFYLFLRKLTRASFTRAREFRRHVTMTAVVDDKSFDIKIETIEEYYHRTKAFVEKAYKLVHNIKDE